MDRPIREIDHWRKDGTVIERHYVGGRKTLAFRDREGVERELGEMPAPEPRVAIHLGTFPANKVRYLSTLARYPGDPLAYVRSMGEVEQRAARTGGRVVKAEELAGDHPVWNEPGVESLDFSQL